MSFLGNAKYLQNICEVEDGTYQVRITAMKIETIKDKNALTVSFKINSSSWNQVPFRYVMFEGDSFDNKFSRFCDCFGADFATAQNEILNNDFHQFRSIGLVKFSHFQRKLVQVGLNEDGTPRNEWKTEKSDYVQIEKLLPMQKSTASQTQQSVPQVQPTQTQIPAQVQKVAQVFGGTIQQETSTVENFGEDIPF